MRGHRVHVRTCLLAGAVLCSLCLWPALQADDRDQLKVGVQPDGRILVPIQGMPWVVLIVLGVLVGWTVLLQRTRFGRYVYAIGGNAQAARRAGVNLGRIRTAC